LVDVFLSATRDQAAAEAFFRSAVEVTGIIPETITSDKHAATHQPSTRCSVMSLSTAPRSTKTTIWSKITAG